MARDEIAHQREQDAAAQIVAGHSAALEMFAEDAGPWGRARGFADAVMERSGIELRYAGVVEDELIADRILLPADGELRVNAFLRTYAIGELCARFEVAI